MNWMIDNWYMVVIIVILFCFLFFHILNLAQKSKCEKMDALYEWLKLAVVEAEKRYGSNTGQLKLRYVYELAVTRFPWLSALVTFETFAHMVDESLDWMRKQLENNKAIRDYTNGGVDNGNN